MDGRCGAVLSETVETRRVLGSAAPATPAYALDLEHWVVLGTLSGDKKVRIKPFDALSDLRQALEDRDERRSCR